MNNSVTRATIFFVAISLWAMVAFPNVGVSQSLGGEGGLGTLLEQLQTLQSQGALDTIKGSRGGALDASRGGLSQEGDSPAFGRTSGHPSAEEQEVIRKIEAARQIPIEAYCQTGRIPAGTSNSELNLLLSPIERDFCRRAAEPLEQFGYGILSTGFRYNATFSGAIQDDYVLGIGDEIVITFHGQTQGTYTERVDREGRVIIGDLPPIPVAGSTFGEFRSELETRVKISMFGTDVFVSLGAVRTISIMVAGEIQRPGLKTLTSQSTVLDALTLAGGVKKIGSLRKIQVFRADEVYWVDIYELLLGEGLSHRLSLLDGDRIVVPSIGPTVAISGQVKRPAIFELAEGNSNIGLGELLELAGGTIRPSGNIYSHMSFDSSGRERIFDYANTDIPVADGEFVHVRLNQDMQANVVEIIGHVRVQGRRSLSAVPTLRALVGDIQGLRNNPYLLFAALETTDPNTRTRRLFPVNLQSIFAGTQDYTLRDQDRLIVLGADDIQYLMSNDVQQVLQFGRAVQDAEQIGSNTSKRKYDSRSNDLEKKIIDDSVQQVLTNLGQTNLTLPSSKNEMEGTSTTQVKSETDKFACRGLQTLATIASTTRTGRFVQAIRALGISDVSPLVNPLTCPPIFDIFPALLPLLLEHVVAVDGEVRSPGAYPVLDATSLSSVLAVAGGLTRDADLRILELTRYSRDADAGTALSKREVINVIDHGFENILINTGDHIRFNRAFTDKDAGPVLLSGEFVRPGLFDIRRGERLSEVIERAGGLTAQAFPYGAVFARERVKKAQQVGFQRAQRELTAAATFAAAKTGVDPNTIDVLLSLSRELDSAEAVGRVVIEADPTVLQVRPEFDTVLEPGDRLFMPKRPNSVLVIGDVLNPGALQFLSGQKADQYIQQAGGFQRSADQDRVFIVYPNGVAHPVSVSVWNYNPSHVPPGSTIVAPKDPAPLNIFTFVNNIGALVSQLAITAASIAVIGD